MEKTVELSYSKRVSRNGECVRTRTKTTKTKKKKVKAHFWRKVVRNLAITIIVLAVIFVAIYFLFIGDNCLIAGHNLQKSDWLAFLGGYISLGATVCLSVITVCQTHYYEKMGSVRRMEDRRRDISPVFSIELKDVSEDMDTFTVELENVGKYPIRNVLVNDIFFFQLLPICEKRKIELSYSNSAKNRILRNDYAQAEESGYSKELVINYENVDGSERFQTFQLKEYGEKLQYQLDADQMAFEDKPKGEIE